MNRVYKVIWSKAKHCYVVTSEIARSVTKSASSARSAGRKGAAVLAMAALLFTAGGVLGEAANVTDVTVNKPGNVITVTKEGGDPTPFTIDNVDNAAHAKEADYATAATKATSDGNGHVIHNTYVKKADAKDNLKVGDDGVISKVTGDDGTTSSPVKTLVLKVDGDNQITMDEKGIKVGTNSTVIASDGVFAGGDTATDAKAALNADGSIKGAEGKFTVGTDGKVTAASGKIGNVDITSDGALTGVRSLGVENINAGGTITGNKLTDGVASLQAGNLNTTGNINAHDINAHAIVATGDISGKAISGTTITGTTITGTSLNTQNGEINGGDIKSSGTIHADGKITGNGLDAGSGGAINGGSLSVTGAMEGNSLTLKGGKLDAGSGTITTTGDIKGNNITADGTITTNNLAVTGGLETDHITLGSEPLNYTKIDKGNVTSKILATDGGVIPIAESIFNKDGSSITVRTNEGSVDSTGNSTVGGKEIIQYLGNNAVPDVKNVTRRMVRNDDGTFSMVDTAVDGKDKYSIVSQNAGERKVTVVEGTKNLNVTENLTNGIVSKTNGGAGKTVTLTQGMDGTYKVETSGNSTEVIGGQKIENYKGGLDTNITGDETHHVTKNQTITVTGDSSLSAKNISNTATVKLSNSAAYIENIATKSITDKVGENTSWKMTDGKISESIVNGTASNKENTTVDGTKRIITNDKGTGIYNQTATSNNISLKNAAGDTYFTKSESLDGEKTSVKNPNGSSTINQSAESIVNFVKNSEGTTKTEQSAKDITNTAKNGTITNNAMDVLNKGANSVINKVGDNKVAVKTDSVKAAYGSDTYTTWNGKGITSNTSGNMRNTVGGKMLNNVTGDMENKVGGDLINTVTGDSSLSATNIKNKASTSITSQIGEDGKVKSEMTADGITNTAEGGTIYNKSKDILNEASGDIINWADGEIGNVATKITNITGNNTVTSDNGGTTFANKDAKTPFEEGDERGTRDNTKITGNKVETGKVLTDFAEVANNLDVKGSTTLGRDENTTLTVNSKSTFKDTVKMDKTLEVDGESTFNNKVTITKGGLNVVKGGTTTDTLTVTGTSVFGGEADFKDNVSMGKGLAVAGETRTGTLYVDHDGYVGGDLNVDGNIETHDAVLSADSRQVVTGRQLYQTNERVDRLDNRIKKVGANAAALAALRPGDFNPDDKFSIAAGFGSYRNASAAALGLFYRPNENVLLSLGTSFGDGENMVNAGVSVKFGRGKSMAERRKEMADEVSSMRDEMRSQDERIAELEEMLKKQSELIEKLSKES